MLLSCPNFLPELCCLRAHFSAVGPPHPKIHRMELAACPVRSLRVERGRDSRHIETRDLWDEMHIGKGATAVCTSSPASVRLKLSVHLEGTVSSSDELRDWETNTVAHKTSPELFSVYLFHPITFRGCLWLVWLRVCIFRQPREPCPHPPKEKDFQLSM